MTNLILFVIFIARIYSQINKASFDIFSHSLGGLGLRQCTEVIKIKEAQHDS